MLIAEFTYNNAKNASTGYTPFELNCNFYPEISFKNDVDPCSRSCSDNKLVKELRELIDIYQQNLLYAQKLQKEHMINAWSLKAMLQERKFG